MGKSGSTKKITEVNNVEFLAKLHLQEKEAMFILSQLRNWMKRFDNAENPPDKSNAKKMVGFWSMKADALFDGKCFNQKIRLSKFKSLMQQLADGDLSYKQTQNDIAA